MIARLRCRCGTLQGELLHPDRTLRAVCYCLDCQTYAHAVHDADRVLDADGGTEVVATRARHVRLTAGADRLTCLSLGPRGILRWFTSCCGTPVVNTPRDPRLPYAGVMHTCLPGDRAATFGPVRMRVNTHRARRPVPKPGMAQSLALLRIGPGLAWDRVSGGWRITPFFDAASGRPVAEPRVLTQEERQQALDAARRTS